MSSLSSAQAAGAEALHHRITLLAVSEVQVTENGFAYVACLFKSGVFGKPVRRAFWGRVSDDGTIAWQRSKPEELQSLLLADLTGIVEIIPIQIEPKEVVNQTTGELSVLRSATIVKLSDETLEQAARAFGVTPKCVQAEQHPSIPAVRDGFYVTGTNGHS
ncbi:MAG: hypothetical protein RhofKO_26330 [Rhodothermales bacterium]